MHISGQSVFVFSASSKFLIPIFFCFPLYNKGYQHASNMRASMWSICDISSVYTMCDLVCEHVCYVRYECDMSTVIGMCTMYICDMRASLCTCVICLLVCVHV
jgi:hypothetical protein